MVLPLLAAAIPAAAGLVGELFKGGDKGGGNTAATHAALGSMLSDVKTDHPALKGTDLPPTLAAVMNGKRSGHVVPHAQTAAGKMGRPGVLAPHLEKAISDLHAVQQQAPVKRHQEKAARAQVRRVEQAVVPQLQQMQKHLRDRAVQVQATAEHRAIVQRDARWQAVANQQRQVLQKLDAIQRRLGPTYYRTY